MPLIAAFHAHSINWKRVLLVEVGKFGWVRLERQERSGGLARVCLELGNIELILAKTFGESLKMVAEPYLRCES